MNLFEVGQLAVKIAGRDAGKTCVIVDVMEDPFVLIDGQTRRRKCNSKHLEPLNKSIKLKTNASHADVKAEFKKLKLEVLETKPKETPPKPQKQRKEKLTAKKEEKKKAVAEKPAAEKKPVEKEKPQKEKEEKKPEVKPSSFEETLEKETKKE